MDSFHWQCGVCGSHCDSRYRSDALIFGREHQCNGRPSRRPVEVTPTTVIKLDRARLQRLIRAVERQQRRSRRQA